MSELLTTKEIAKYLKLRPETVLRKVNREKITAIKVGGRFRFDKQQIEEWLHFKSTSRKRVLIVVDDEATKRLFKETLEIINDYRVITAQGSKEALKLIEDRDFDLIFIDLKMPGINGAELLGRIRQINDSVPIVIITSYAKDDLLKQALEQGPLGVIKKPFNASDIRRSADSFLRGIKVKDNLKLIEKGS